MATFIPNVTDVFPEPALFTPDFAFMDKMLARRQAMYDQGWSQVNAAYGFVNRKLTNPSNVKDRDIFLKQAKENLKGLSAMDLSQRQNVNAANNVFLPWANNEKALGDAALTAHWDREEQIGDGYRLQDGGKLYSDFNVNWVRKQRNAFANDAPDTWGEYFKTKRSYIPYYNYTEEINKLMKDFKPSTYEIDKLNGLYKITDKNASWTQAEIRKFLDANLSEAAKRQMRIEGDVLYNNDPKVLGQIYTTNAQNELKEYDDGIAVLNKLLGSETKKEKIQEYKEYISKLEEKKKTLTDNLETIKKGDYTMIKKNGENLGFNLHYNQVLNRSAKGWSHNDITHKISADDVALEIYSQNRQDARQKAAFAHAEKMAYMKGEIAPPPQATELQTKDVTAVSQDAIRENVNKIHAENKQLEDLNKGMVLTWMKQVDPTGNKNKTIADVGIEDIKNYQQQGINGKPLPADHPFFSNNNRMAENEMKIGIQERRISDAREKVKEGYSAEQKQALANAEQQIAKIGSITLPDGKVVTAGEIYQQFRRDPNTIQVGSWGAGAGDYILTINGKTYRPGVEGGIDFNQFRTVVGGIKNSVKNIDEISNFDKDVNEYFKKNAGKIVNTANLLTFSKGSYEAKTLESELYNVLPEAQYSIQHAGIGADAVNQGSSYFFVTPKSGVNATSKDIKAYFQQRGYKDVEAIETTGTGAVLYQVKNFNSNVIKQYAQFNPMEKLVIQDMSTTSPNMGTYQSGAYKSYSNRKLQVMRSNNLYYLNVEGLNGDNTFGMFPQPFNDPASAVLMGQRLTATVGSVPEAYLQNYMQLANQ